MGAKHFAVQSTPLNLLGSADSEAATGLLVGMFITQMIMRDVDYGWALRYTHANVASFFFIFVYSHMARGLYYNSYKSPRVAPWTIGVIILVLMIATAFLGYCLVYGQMSLWGATVITNLLSAIPWIGNDFVEFEFLFYFPKPVGF